MKELSIKEKAKAYDKVLEWAKEAHKVCDGMLKEDLEHLFPELKESEDERIRKAIIEYIKTGTYHKSWIDWLEKQGEQKANVVVRRFLIGDTFIDKYNPTNVFTVTEYIENGIAYVDQSGERFTKYYDDSWDDYQLIEQKPAWSEEDESNLQGIIDEIKANKNHAPAYDLATYNRFLSWLKSLKDRVQQQHEWSEEDEEMIDSIIGNIKYLYSIGSCDNATVDMKVNWLKSLSPHSQWKPSEEQMKQLHKYCPDNRPLTQLYQDLKKLREE